MQTQRPVRTDETDRDLFAPPPVKEANLRPARGTASSQILTPPPVPSRRATTVSPLATTTLLGQVAPRIQPPPPNLPAAAPFVARPSAPPMRMANGSLPPTNVAFPLGGDNETTQIEPIELLEVNEVNEVIEPAKSRTMIVARPTPPWSHTVPKLVAPALVLTIAAVFVAGYIKFDGDGGKPRTPVEVAVEAPAQVVIPAAATAPAIEPMPVTPPNLAPSSEPPPPAEATVEAPAFVEVRFDSTPAGATVVLVDGGKQTFVGPTPITTAVDPSRTYEVRFTYPNRAPQVQALDPSKTTRLAVRIPAPARRTAAVSPLAPAVAPAAIPAGEGTLMISSKPPCEILIDGVSTGLTTPQREIKLRPGRHKVTLVNAAEGIKKTLSIDVTSGAPTKVIQDLMAR